MRLFSILGAALALSVPAHAAEIIGVYFPGSNITWTYGINDKLEVAGTYYMNDRTVHAFYGLAGSSTYHSFQFGGASTGARSIDNKGNIVGISHFFDGETYCEYVPFARTPDGKTTQIHRGKTALNGFVQGMDLHSGKFVGDVCDADGNSVGYQGRKSEWRTDLDIPIPSAQPRGINASGTIVGSFQDGKLIHGFVFKNGVASVVDFPGAKKTQLLGVNDAGIAVGDHYRGFHYLPMSFDTNTNTFTEIKFHRHQFGAAFASAINSDGYITINLGNGRGYVLCPEGADCPGGQKADVELRRIQVGRLPVYRRR